MNVGDKVKYLNQTGGGVVIQLRSDEEVVISDDDGFEYTVFKKDLVLAKGFDFQLPEKGIAEIGAEETKKTPKKSEKRKKKETNIPFEIDLHIHQITDYSIETKRVSLIEIQMNYLLERLEQERSNGIKNFVVIHGVGEGKLKEEIRKYLSSIEGCSYEDANILKYGRGATRVTFWKVLNT